MQFPLQLHDLGIQHGSDDAVYRVFDSTGALVASTVNKAIQLGTADMRELVRRANAYSALTNEVAELKQQLAKKQTLPQSIQDALNSGDGSYKP